MGNLKSESIQIIFAHELFLEFQKQLSRYITALRTLAMERSRLLELLITGYPAAWGHKDQIKRSHKEQDSAIENCVTKEKVTKLQKINV